MPFAQSFVLNLFALPPTHQLIPFSSMFLVCIYLPTFIRFRQLGNDCLAFLRSTHRTATNHRAVVVKRKKEALRRNAATINNVIHPCITTKNPKCTDVFQVDPMITTSSLVQTRLFPKRGQRLIRLRHAPDPISLYTKL